MPKRMIAVSNVEASTTRLFDMRQGLDMNPLVATNAVANTAGTNGLAVAPDMSYAILGLGAITNNIWFYNDPENLTDRVAPGASFSSAVSSLAASNEFYAFGGSNPNVYVFSRSTGALETVNTAGLGTVYALDFSPDGKYLAVTHTTSPYVRIYKTSDWSYINAATQAGGNCYGCCFSHDSTKLVTRSGSSPFLCTFNPETGVRGLALSTTGYQAPNAPLSKICVRSSLDNETLIFSMGQPPFIGKFNTSTDTASLFTAVSPAIAVGSGHLVVDPDPEEDAVYMFHSPGSTSPSRAATKFKISTGVAYDDQPAALRTFLAAASTNSVGAYIMETNKHRIRGTVRDVNNNPASRVVRAYKRDTAEVMAQTTSDPVTGDYTLKVYDAGPYDVQFMTEPGESLNDLFFSKTEPEPL